MSYAGIRSQSRKTQGCPKFANGGRVAGGSKGATTINIVVPPASGGQGPAPSAAPMGPGMGTPPMPVPPVAANAAMGAMGAPPAPPFRNGGKVKAGAMSGVHRKQVAKKG